MESLWQTEALAFPENGDDLDMRVYTSRLLGMSEDLVLHGGGNTSVKSKMKDFFGDEHDVLLVKGSGWDLKTIERPGFAPVKLDAACRLATLETLSDKDMVEQLRLALLDQSAPTPSVEAILHAILPYKYVDHSHTDAVVTVSNTPNGTELLKEIYPDVLILPYIMPGFILSKQVYDAIQDVDLSDYKGIILEHHGLFTFSDDAKESYENHISLVTRAEEYLTANAAEPATAEGTGCPLELAKIRKQVSELRGRAVLAKYDGSPAAAGFASLSNVDDLATRGPMTPDHVIRNKRIAAVIGDDALADVAAFDSNYKAYFNSNKEDGLTILDDRGF